MSEWVTKYVGIPFVDLGRTPEEGFDCWGLLTWIYEHELGVDLGDRMRLVQDQVDSNIEAYREVRFSGLWEKTSEPKVGDAILFTINGRHPHVAVYIGMGRMIHSPRGGSVCIERINSTKWSPRLEGYYSYKQDLR